uniref:Uncharacterized protein n=1 Tax=Oryza barthii TaxID=65489 RepID=A0A0D3HJB0_9ORYZ
MYQPQQTFFNPVFFPTHTTSPFSLPCYCPFLTPYLGAATADDDGDDDLRADGRRQGDKQKRADGRRRDDRRKRGGGATTGGRAGEGGATTTASEGQDK